MNTALKNRVEALEARANPAATLLAIVRPGETADEAIFRTAAAWGRPLEEFRTKIVLDFVSPGTGEGNPRAYLSAKRA